MKKGTSELNELFSISRAIFLNVKQPRNAMNRS